LIMSIPSGSCLAAKLHCCIVMWMPLAPMS
jgi:hypothetical protein